MNDTLKPGSIWTPTKDTESTFPRHVDEIRRSKKASPYDRVAFRRILKDGDLGVETSCYVDSWRAWVRQFGAVAGDAPRDTAATLREALTSVRAFVALHHDEMAVECLREIDAALGA